MRNDDQQNQQQAGDAQRAASGESAKAGAIIPMPRNTPNIEPPAVDLSPSGQTMPLLALPAPKSSTRMGIEDAIEPDEPYARIDDAETVTVADEAPRASNRFALLAASVAAAAVLGSVAGSLATAGLTGLMAKHPPVQQAAVTPALKQTVAQLGAELASLKASVEAVNRTNTAQYAHISERFDRVEHGQTEPAAKLAKITEQLDRIEHRPAAVAAVAPAAPPQTPASVALAGPSPEITGSISQTRPGAAPGGAAAPETKPAKPPILENWVLRGVYRGRALVESRYGEFEVIPGSNLPGLGRVEDVTRQDGRWFVVTQKGLITSMR
jgi:hypothetical protein